MDYFNFFSGKGNDIDIDKIAESLRDKLKRFGGKLYKYYGLSSQYTLSNIEKDIVYLNTPKFFNDPFDCYLGLESDQVLIQFCVTLLCEDKLKLESRQAEAFYRFIVGEDLRQFEIDFLNLQMEIYTPELPRNSIQIWTSKSIKEKFELFGRLIGLAEEEIQYVISLSQKLSQLQNNVEDEINKNFVITCFCESYKNELMWAHYAEKHQGICVEYDFRKLFVNDPESIYKLLQLYPVIYSNERPSIPVTTDVKGEFHYMVKEGKYSSEDKLRALLTKSNVWQYEKEWRLIMPGLSYQILELPIISKIFLGAKIFEENEAKIIKLASEKKIKVYKMNIHPYRYDFLEPSLVTQT